MTNASAAITADESRFIKNGIRQAVYCETYGLLTVLFLYTLFGQFPLVYKFPLSIALGIVGLYVWAFISGGAAGKIVYRLGLKSSAIWIIGILLAWSNILAMGLAQTSIVLFEELKANNFGGELPYYIFMLIGWSIVVALVPAPILGYWWARQMRKNLTADDSQRRFQ